MSEEKQKTYRLFKIAKELNVAISTLASFLQSKGFSVDENDPNAKLSSEMYDALLKEYTSPKKSKEKASILKQKQQENKVVALTPASTFKKTTEIEQFYNDEEPLTAQELKNQVLTEAFASKTISNKANEELTKPIPQTLVDLTPKESPSSLTLPIEQLYPSSELPTTSLEKDSKEPQNKVPLLLDLDNISKSPTIDLKNLSSIVIPKPPTDTVPEKEETEAIIHSKIEAKPQPSGAPATVTEADTSEVSEGANINKTAAEQELITPNIIVPEEAIIAEKHEEKPEIQNLPEAVIVTEPIKVIEDAAIQGTAFDQSKTETSEPQNLVIDDLAQLAPEPKEISQKIEITHPTPSAEEVGLAEETNTDSPEESQVPKNETSSSHVKGLKIVGNIDLSQFEPKKPKKTASNKSVTPIPDTESKTEKATEEPALKEQPDQVVSEQPEPKSEIEAAVISDNIQSFELIEKSTTDTAIPKEYTPQVETATSIEPKTIEEAAIEKTIEATQETKTEDLTLQPLVKETQKPLTDVKNKKEKAESRKQKQTKQPTADKKEKAVKESIDTIQKNEQAPIEEYKTEIAEIQNEATAEQASPASVAADLIAPENEAFSIAEASLEEQQASLDDDNQAVIRAKDHAPKLMGLKVMGKIELPETKKAKAEKEKAEKEKAEQEAREKSRNKGKKAAPDGNNKKQTDPAKPGLKPAAGATAKPADIETDADKKKKKRKRKRKATTELPLANSPQRGSNNNAPAKTGSGNQTSGKTANKSAPDNKKPKQREEVSSKQVKDNIRNTLFELNKGSNRKRQNIRKEKRQVRANQRIKAEQEKLAESNVLEVTEFLTANELANLMEVSVNEVIGKCMELGMIVSINQRINADIISLIAEEFGYEVRFISVEESFEEVEEEELEGNLVPRPPIVTVMGHVDHGKTSLLDYIRKTNVIAGEAGGITQHIGAYYVTLEDGRSLCFLDTPGHEAFTAMRARGAQVTDIAIIVIAADDQVMPQTREAINHAQAAGVPMVFAINKIDKPGAQPDKIREQLSQMNLLVEEWGGKFQCQEIAAKHGKNVDELLEKVLLEAELLDLKANPDRLAKGTVIEAQLDKGRGVVTTVLVQNGTLKVGDVIIANSHYGRVKAMMDERGKRIKKAGPAMPVQILGLDGVPQAGDKFQVLDSEREARELATKRQQLLREQSIRMQKHITLEEIARRSALGDFKELNIIVKGDVDGSVEALADSLIRLSTEEVAVKIIMKGVGQISESDVLLASASNAIIVGFQVRPSSNARKLISQEAIDVRMYSVIYDAINEIKDALEGLLKPKLEEEIVGVAEVRDVFRISKVGSIAGCYVTEGIITRNATARLVREGIVIFTGKIESLKRFKDDTKEVKEGFECGIGIENYNDIKVGDLIEVFTMKEIKRTISSLSER